MSTVGWLPADAGELFGTDATAEESYEVLTVDVPPASWISALETARDRLGCTYFDWLSAVDEPGTGFRVTAHVAALSPLRRLLLRTTVPHEAAALPSAVGVYAGAAWHERETHEMFGITFEGHPALDHLLLPDNFEGHPLRKDFVLAARVAKAWPGAKEPGEPEHGGPKRRQMLPPGVPDPNEWGPLKGQLPPAPARPARGTARAAGERPARGAARPAGERPVRRTRSAAEGSASQATTGDEPTTAPAAPRRTRSAAEGSASQSAPGERAAGAPEGPRRARSAAEGSVSQSAAEDTSDATPATPRPARTAADGSASRRLTGAESPTSDTESPTSDTESPTSDTESPTNGSDSAPAGSDSAPTGSKSPAAGSDRPSRPVRSSDAPWHHARPAFGEPVPEPVPEPAPEGGPVPPPAPADDSGGEKTPEAGGAEQTPEVRENPGNPADDRDPGTDTPDDPTGGPR
ncbi:NADH-quinone oxidoreductase subunit C [Streptomyces djakartensis]|uniref:Dehydrogenase n=1 Tax=Streptomyces djakartensis TaxID=68193 RepID=A0ABQ2Z7Z7_9ACTN|nr:NADH-quinone oxidoreductase subunit C [Streptomyces djakartensis]GGY04075.1 dehydrogenase [Streptomyces djakartensis]